MDSIKDVQEHDPHHSQGPHMPGGEKMRNTHEKKLTKPASPLSSVQQKFEEAKKNLKK